MSCWCGMGAIAQCVEPACYQQYCPDHLAQVRGGARPDPTFLAALRVRDPQAADSYAEAFLHDARVLCPQHRHHLAVVACRPARDRWPDDPAQAVVATMEVSQPLGNQARPIELPWREWWTPLAWLVATGRTLGGWGVPATSELAVAWSAGATMATVRCYKIRYAVMDPNNPYPEDETLKVTAAGEVYCCSRTSEQRFLRRPIHRLVPMRGECEHIRRHMVVREAVDTLRWRWTASQGL